MKIIFIIFFDFFATVILAQNISPLTVEKIMSDAKWMGVPPSNLQWDQNSSTLYFNWNPENALRDPYYQITLADLRPAKTVDPEKKNN